MAIRIINDIKNAKSKAVQVDDTRCDIVYYNVVDPDIKLFKNSNDDENIYIIRNSYFHTFKDGYDDLGEYFDDNDISDSWEATDLELTVTFSKPEIF